MITEKRPDGTIHLQVEDRDITPEIKKQVEKFFELYQQAQDAYFKAEQYYYEHATSVGMDEASRDSAKKTETKPELFDNPHFSRRIKLTDADIDQIPGIKIVEDDN